MNQNPATASVRQLVTHDGRFHADEVMATAVLRALFPLAEIVRTRDPDLICASTDRIVYDVGGLYLPQTLLFDHHQLNAPTRDDGTPYSSFGLVWRHFGRDWLRHAGIREHDVDLVHGLFDLSVVLAIDLTDTGVRCVSQAGFLKPVTLPCLIEDMAPPFDCECPRSMQEAFVAAVDMAVGVIRSRINSIVTEIRAEEIVREALRETGISPILELPRHIPFDSAIAALKADRVLFVIAPRPNDWVLSAVSVVPGTRTKRSDLPSSWAGLDGHDLAIATGVPDAKFCHRGLFLAGAKTRDGIMRMAEAAVANAQLRGALAQPEPQRFSWATAILRSWRLRLRAWRAKSAWS